MKLDSLILNVVNRCDASRAGIVIVVFPAHHFAIVAHGAAYVDHARWPKISPGEFLFASPHYFDRPLRRPRQPGSLNGGFACVLASVARARVRHQHSNAFFRHTKSLGKFTAHAERTLGAGPHGQTVT